MPLANDVYEVFAFPPDATPSQWADSIDSHTRAEVFTKVRELVDAGSDREALFYVLDLVPEGYNKLSAISFGVPLQSTTTLRLFDVAFVRLCYDAYCHYKLPEDDPCYIQYLPLVTGFSVNERKVVMERIVNIIATYFKGKVPFTFPHVRQVYDHLHSDRRFYIHDDAPLARDRAPLFDLKPLLSPGVIDEKVFRLQRLQDIVLDRWAQLNGGPTPSFHVPTRTVYGVRGYNDLMPVGHGGVKVLEELDDKELQAIVRYAGDIQRRNRAIESVLSEVLATKGVVQNYSGLRGHELNLSGKQGPNKKDNGDHKNKMGQSYEVAVELRHLWNADESASEYARVDSRARNDPRISTTFEDFNDWIDELGEIHETLQSWSEEGDQVGCIINGCHFTRDSMKTHGLSPGSWFKTNLPSLAHEKLTTTRLLCTRHFQLATYLAKAWNLNDLLIRIFLEDDDELQMMARYGHCAQSTCNNYGVVMPLMGDPLHVLGWVCRSCNEARQKRKERLEILGKKALSRGALHRPPDSLNDNLVVCQANETCLNPCVRGEKRSVSHDYGQWGYVCKKDNNIVSCCRQHFIDSGGVASRDVVTVLGTTIDRAVLNRTALDLLRQFMLSKDSDALWRDTLVKARHLALVLYKRPVTVGFARMMLVRALEDADKVGLAAWFKNLADGAEQAR
ncbi:uncharacterized protein LOC62_02G003216 [Vanrija pseudolonga]|uniref:Uncharacterized protein n=1 Tax=Vanrija pseudolonga TaxID=143232 RepID=A0AAF0Y8I9_9TREE|nr:hypothetical protein LOC62_02G003216 [Vanrija pseudolonga]